MSWSRNELHCQDHLILITLNISDVALYLWIRNDNCWFYISICRVFDDNRRAVWASRPRFHSYKRGIWIRLNREADFILNVISITRTTHFWGSIVVSTQNIVHTGCRRSVGATSALSNCSIRMSLTSYYIVPIFCPICSNLNTACFSSVLMEWTHKLIIMILVSSYGQNISSTYYLIWPSLWGHTPHYFDLGGILRRWNHKEEIAHHTQLSRALWISFNLIWKQQEEES